MGHFLVSPPWSASSLTRSVKQCTETFSTRLLQVFIFGLQPALVCILSPSRFCSLLDLFSLDHFPQETSTSFHFSPNILHISQALGYFQVEAGCNDLST